MDQYANDRNDGQEKGHPEEGVFWIAHGTLAVIKVLPKHSTDTRVARWKIRKAYLLIASKNSYRVNAFTINTMV